jgi:capsid portal protein
MTQKPLLPAKKDDYWPCACVKRDRNGNMKAIKLNHPQVTQCRVCKCTKPEKE